MFYIFNIYNFCSILNLIICIFITINYKYFFLIILLIKNNNLYFILLNFGIKILAHFELILLF